MSRIRADQLVNRVGSGGPKFPNGVAEGFSITGIVTATGFKKADGTEVGGVIAGINTAGVSTFTDLELSGNLSVDGNLTVNGTQTILNTTSLEVEDKNIGLASATSRLSDAQVDGAGITIYSSGGDKTLTWDNGNSRMAFSTDVYAPQLFGSVAASQLTGALPAIDGSQLTGIDAGGISTTASSPTANSVVTLDLSSAQHHELTLSAGITTITCSGGAMGESHSVILIQPSSGISTVGFSTYFLFPSGSIPAMSEGGSKVDLLSFVVKQVGAGGTQLLASAGLNYQ
tara:strand:+ start:2522 stop:3379 length:858 start_codon:yes stop_codon:yes gene_type:complete